MPVDLEKLFGWDNSSFEKGEPHDQPPSQELYGLHGRRFDYWLYPDGTNCGYKTLITTKTGFFIVNPGKFYGGPIVGFAIMASLYKYSKQCGISWIPLNRKAYMTGDYDAVTYMPDHSVGKNYGPLTGHEDWNTPTEKSGW